MMSQTSATLVFSIFCILALLLITPLAICFQSKVSANSLLGPLIRRNRQKHAVLFSHRQVVVWRETGLVIILSPCPIASQSPRASEEKCAYQLWNYPSAPFLHFAGIALVTS
ncbi:hypothetical protein BS50DRAFT_574015 [Corynespora cassiicola Philippines]|uniref:Uncharacterized protein n=1 Tax=Corynespora cassiicola Philippines TaxID=1448308 RepID=A0A2T2NPW2_CORCC|nr:hypothetical protein BS50DRAFT_574015 [Corynespora cassiicola Philippines]